MPAVILKTEEIWKAASVRQGVVTKLEKVIQRSGLMVLNPGIAMEHLVYLKANTREEYINMVANLIHYIQQQAPRRAKKLNRHR